MFKKLINLFKKSKPKIVSKGDDFIMFTSEEGMTEEVLNTVDTKLHKISMK